MTPTKPPERRGGSPGEGEEHGLFHRPPGDPWRTAVDPDAEVRVPWTNERLLLVAVPCEDLANQVAGVTRVVARIMVGAAVAARPDDRGVLGEQVRQAGDRAHEVMVRDVPETPQATR